MIIGLSGYISSGKSTIAQMISYIISQYQTHGQLHDKFDPNDSLGHQHHSQWFIKAFAYKLKQIVSLLTGIPVVDLEKESVKSSELGKEWSVFEPIKGIFEVKTGTREIPMTVRTLLQKLGTNACRNLVHENIWVNALFTDYRPNFPNSRYKYKNVKTGLEFKSGSELRGKREYDCLGPVEESNPNWIISDTRFSNEAQAIKDRGGIVVRINRPEPIKMHDPNSQFYRIKHSSETSLDSWAFDYTIDNSGSLEELLEQVRTMLLHFKIII